MKRNWQRFGLCLVALGMAGLSTGCMDLTGRGPAPLEQTAAPTVPEAYPRQGRVYCMRGWLGIFSTGMDHLAVRIDREVGTPAVSVADEEATRLFDFLRDEADAGRLDGQPLILVGHSYGADDQIRIARKLAALGVTVDLLITLDPVTPPAIPANVRRAINIYKSHPATDAIPAWRGVQVAAEDPAKTPVSNINLRTEDVGFETASIDHINIEKNAGVHALVMEQIRQICPRRDTAVVQAAPKTARPQPASPVAAREQAVSSGATP